MPKSERTVLSLYYYEELNLREIGEVMGMHLSRVAQLRTQAILRLRSHMERVWFNPAKEKSMSAGNTQPGSALDLLLDIELPVTLRFGAPR